MGVLVEFGFGFGMGVVDEAIDGLAGRSDAAGEEGEVFCGVSWEPGEIADGVGGFANFVTTGRDGDIDRAEVVPREVDTCGGKARSLKRDRSSGKTRIPRTPRCDAVAFDNNAFDLRPLFLHSNSDYHRCSGFVEPRRVSNPLFGVTQLDRKRLVERIHRGVCASGEAFS